MAKQLRKLTNAMKRILSKHELNADDFRLDSTSYSHRRANDVSKIKALQ